ncbi:MAG: helix-turn-helix transcriptional regulator [Solirubrobacterales bacterium]
MTKRNDKHDADSRPEPAQGVFMISVAADLAGMHPQTLRVYEARGLIKPNRSPKGTRLYSQHDVESLRRIQELTTQLGMNLAGVERVLVLERTMDAMRAQLRELQERADLMEQDVLDRIEQVHRSYKRELVPWEPPGQMLKASDARSVRIPIRKSGFSLDGKTGNSGGAN